MESGDDAFLPELWTEIGDDEFMHNLLGVTTTTVQAPNHNPLLDLSADKIKIWLDRVHKLLAEEA